MRIIFLHHAGGDKYAFNPYRSLTEAAGLEMTAYDFPGHGDRFNEPLLTDAVELAMDAYERLFHLLEGDYLLFGNSMGSLPAYLMLQHIHAAGRRLPVRFFAAARKCPASYPPIDQGKPLSDSEFWKMIAEYGGPSGLQSNPELRELYEPILRADYKILGGYKHDPLPPLPVPATILYGSDDRYSREDVRTWKEHFSGPVDLQVIEGGHFFVYEEAEKVMEAIRDRITS